MKRKNNYKNTGRLSFIMGSLAVSLLSSCYKDKSPGALDLSKSPALISFQYAGLTATPYIFPVLAGTATFPATIQVTLSAQSVTLKTAVSATLVSVPDSITSYNTANELTGTVGAFVSTPTTEYSIPNGGKVTINPGQQIINIPIVFTNVDFNVNNGLALMLTNAQGALIPSNLNTALILIKVKSLYDDTYTASGARTRFNGASEASGFRDSFAISGDVTETTYDVSTVVGQAADTGSGYTVGLQVNATGATPYSVTVIPDPTAGAGGTPDAVIQGDSKGQSTYNPATKTFVLHYGYLNSAGALREVDEVLVGQ